MSATSARRAGAAGAAVCLAALILVPSAAAHAYLLQADPGPNEQVDAAPRVVWLQFTENIEREYTRAEVLDLDGNRRDDGAPQFYPAGRQDALLVHVAPLDDGVYTVRWRTLSVDTHTAEGSFVFAVGNASLEGASPPISGGHRHAGGPAGYGLEVAARAVYFAGLLAAVGLPFFAVAVARGAGADATSADRHLRGAAAMAAAAAALAGALLVALFAARVGLPAAHAALQVRTGRFLALRSGLCAVAALLFLAARRPARGARGRTLAAGGGLAASAALVATSASSHAAAAGGVGSPAFLADLVHLAGGSLWLGGLAGLALLGPRASPADLARLVFGFSPWAVGSVLAAAATGVYAATLHLGGWSQLASTTYGRAVLTKALLLLPLAALGAWNRYRVGPRLRRAEAPTRSLAGPVRAELLLLAVVLAAAGVLATTAPPAAQAGVPSGPPTLTFERSLETAHLVFTVAPSPVRVGIQNFTVAVHPVSGAAPATGTEVFMKFARANASEPEELIPMARLSTDAWGLRGGYLTERGAWRLFVIVQRPDEFAKLEFGVNVE